MKAIIAVIAIIITIAPAVILWTCAAAGAEHEKEGGKNK